MLLYNFRPAYAKKSTLFSIVWRVKEVNVKLLILLLHWSHIPSASSLAIISNFFAIRIQLHVSVDIMLLSGTSTKG